MIENSTTEDFIAVKKIKTFIPGFEDISFGGLPKGRATMVTGSSGSGKTVLALQFLINGIIESDEGGVFVTFEETPADIRRNFKSFGWDLEKFENSKKLVFVDVSPEPDQEVIEVGDYDFSGLLSRIENAVKKVNATRVGMDSIGALFSQYASPGIVRRELFRITAALKIMGLTSLMTSERTEEYGQISRYGVEEFVADNVIILRNILEDEKRRRTIEILKFRGTMHKKGEFPFTVSDEGMVILPLSSMQLTMKSSDVRLSSGCKELDIMCGGGFFRDSIILASGATGTGKTLLVTTFSDEGCRLGQKTLVLAFEESRAQLLRNAIGWGKDFQTWERQGLLKIVCVYPESEGLPDHLLNMKKLINEFSPERVAVDSLSALERAGSFKGYREFVIGLTSFIKERQIAGLFTSISPMLTGGVSVTDQHISTITDSIILMRYVELMGEMRRGLTVLKMRGSWHDKSIREYFINENGLQIGRIFSNVGGILIGLPRQMNTEEVEKEEIGKLGEMFGNV